VDFLAEVSEAEAEALSEHENRCYAELNPYFFTLQTPQTVFTSNQLRAQEVKSQSEDTDNG
jgi:hypothetical protein